MYNSDTELLFPARIIPKLRRLRGELWNGLVKEVMSKNLDDLDRLAFVLLMIRLSGCTTCNTDSYRAMRGCTLCACQTVGRYQGSDQDLVNVYVDSRKDLEKIFEQVET